MAGIGWHVEASNSLNNDSICATPYGSESCINIVFHERQKTGMVSIFCTQYQIQILAYILLLEFIFCMYGPVTQYRYTL